MPDLAANPLSIFEPKTYAQQTHQIHQAVYGNLSNIPGSCRQYNKVMGLYSDLKNMLQNTAKSCDSFKATPPKFVECMSKKLPVITSQAALTSSYYNKIVLPEKNRSPWCVSHI